MIGINGTENIICLTETLSVKRKCLSRVRPNLYGKRVIFGIVRLGKRKLRLFDNTLPISVA